MRFRYTFSESDERIDGDVFGPMLSVSGYRGIELKAYDDENRRRLPEELQGYRVVRRGQLVINTMWMNFAGLGISDFDGHVSPAYRSYNICDIIYPRFAHYLLRSNIYITAYKAFLTGIRPNSLQMSRDDLMNFPILLPPIVDQRAIATFLGHETAKIDALIAEQERLIALLNEKRQAVISHAVTKGLDPRAPMKESGVEWIGKVPEHWIVTTAKRVSTIFVPQRNKPELNADGNGVCWVTMENMSLPEITATELWVSDDAALEAGSRILKAGAVIGSCVGLFGAASINRTDVIINQQLQAFIPHTQMLAEFLRYLVAGSSCYFNKIGTAATLIYVNQLGFQNLPVVVPPRYEQVAIVAFAECETAKFAVLINEMQRSIILLQERRAVLISAAVTGKVDVRELVENTAPVQAVAA